MGFGEKAEGHMGQHTATSPPLFCEQKEGHASARVILCNTLRSQGGGSVPIQLWLLPPPPAGWLMPEALGFQLAAPTPVTHWGAAAATSTVPFGVPTIPLTAPFPIPIPPVPLPFPLSLPLSAVLATFLSL